MARFAHSDIAIELAELCQELLGEIRGQLNYYRASVYKTETSKYITRKVEQLRLLSDFLADEILLEAFSDHDAHKDMAGMNVAPGECSLSTRTSQLIQAFELQLEQIIEKASLGMREAAPHLNPNRIQRHRKQILSICKQGTRHWAFFQTL